MNKKDSFADRSAPHPYQEAAVQRLRNLEYAGIFHEQGLGKTKIGLSIALHWLRTRAVDVVLVVTKKLIVPTWLREVSKHTELVGQELGPRLSTAAMSLTGPGRFFITNYERLPKLGELLEKWLRARRVGVILDESHAIKNPERGVSEMLHKLRGLFARRLIMSGTPSANRPYDMWNQVRFLDGGRAFGMDYKTAKRTLDLPTRAGEASGFQSRLTQVNARLALFTSRETKATAGLSLPPKYIHDWRASLERRQALLYADYVAEAQVLIARREKLTFDDNKPLLKRIGRLLECVANPEAVDHSYDEQPGKDPVLLEVLSHKVRGDKAIVWTSYRENAERLQRVVGANRSVVVHGGVGTTSRLRRLGRFSRAHTGPQLLIATPASCKEGLTLTEATHVIYYDRSLSLDDYEQSQDRIHRISQTRTCHVHRIIAVETIDEWVEVLLEVKKAAASVVQGDRRAGNEEDWTSHREMFSQILGRGTEK